jgi:4-hydroxy-3-polyprenylbenzoate decarboxylase
MEPPEALRPRVVVGISSASGGFYGVRLLQRLRVSGFEIHLVASPAGVLNAHHELGLDRASLERVVDPRTRPC